MEATSLTTISRISFPNYLLVSGIPYLLPCNINVGIVHSSCVELKVFSPEEVPGNSTRTTGSRFDYAMAGRHSETHESCLLCLNRPFTGSNRSITQELDGNCDIGGNQVRINLYITIELRQVEVDYFFVGELD